MSKILLVSLDELKNISDNKFYVYCSHRDKMFEIENILLEKGFRPYISIQAMMNMFDEYGHIWFACGIDFSNPEKVSGAADIIPEINLSDKYNKYQVILAKDLKVGDKVKYIPTPHCGGVCCGTLNMIGGCNRCPNFNKQKCSILEQAKIIPFHEGDFDQAFSYLNAFPIVIDEIGNNVAYCHQEGRCGHFYLPITEELVVIK
jgi:hypothetical protein